MDALIDGIKVPNSLLGQLHETNLSKSNNNELKSNLEKDGYLFLRNVIEENKIEEARNDVFKKLSEVDELADPFNEGIFSGR